MKAYGKFLLAVLFFTIFSENSVKTQFFRKPPELSTPSLVRDAGYQLQAHTVTTADGYVLTLYRLPPTKTSGAPRVAFLMHGFQRSSIDWVLSGPGKSLAYNLADAGYDVWLGNARGTRYSRAHATKSAASADYWNFSWHEIGVYDLPAFIEFIVQATGAPRLHYIGHSQGATDFIVASSTVPRFNERIKTAQLLGGGIYYNHSPTVRSLLPFEPALKLLVDLFGHFDLGSTSSSDERLINSMCKDGTISQPFCAARLFFVVGWNSPYLNRTLLPQITVTDKSGASSKQLLHFMQTARTARFRQFDFGSWKNRRVYRRATPPDYDLSAISAPTYLYFCDSDGIADARDAERLARVWPKASLRGFRMLPFHNCNHVDFFFGINVTDYLNTEILNVLNSYENTIS